MHNTHGRVAIPAVGDLLFGCYLSVMKPIPHPNNGKPTVEARSRNRNRFNEERRKHGGIHWTPPAITHRRYPSLAEDFERLSPPSRPTYRAAVTKTAPPADTFREEIWSKIPWVRVIALAALVATIAALAANA